MTTRQYIDTSAIYAAYDKSDPRHAEAVAHFSELGDASLITHLSVVTEVTALLERRFGPDVCNAFVDDLLSSIAVFHGLEVVNIRAMAAFRAGRGRRRPSLTDCLSFETMREFELDTAFAFDEHFIEAGFVVVP